MADSDDETFDQAKAAAVLAAAAKSTGLERTGWMTKKGEVRGVVCDGKMAHVSISLLSEYWLNRRKTGDHYMQLYLDEFT